MKRIIGALILCSTIFDPVCPQDGCDEGDEKKFRTFFADPVVGAEGDPLYSYYADHKGAVPVQELIKKYPYRKAREIVLKGCR